MFNRLQSFLIRHRIDALQSEIEHHRKERELHQQAIGVLGEMKRNYESQLLANGSRI